MTSRKQEAHIGRRLASARIQRGISQRSVGRSVGLAPSYLSRIENGRIEPSFRMVQRIAAALGVGIHELTGTAGQVKGKPGGCPISQSGRCMLDLIRSGATAAKAASGEGYTAREIRMLQRLSEWMRSTTPDRLRALEIILKDLSSAGAPPAVRQS